MWIRKDCAFEAIASQEEFYTAQGIIKARARRFSAADLIEKLRGLYERLGFFSGLVIDETEGMPSAAAYIHRFGSLIRAYQAVGFTPARDYQFLEVNKFLRRLHPEVDAGTGARDRDRSSSCRGAGQIADWTGPARHDLSVGQVPKLELVRNS